MDKWQSETFQNNHRRLAAAHGVLCALYLLLSIILIGSQSANHVFLYIGVFLAVLFALPHGILAYGSSKKIEASRRASEILFALWFLNFPIGLFIAMYWLLPWTQWKNPEIENAAKDAGITVNSDAFASNHLRVMKVHIAFAVVCCASALLLILVPTRDDHFFSFLAAFVLGLGAIQCLLAYGCYKRREIARRFSKAEFILVCVLVFPLGMLISLYFLLPLTRWQTPDKEEMRQFHQDYQD